MTIAREILLMSAAIALATAPLRAHHSFAAEFDGKKPVTLTGTLTKLEWTNPHAHFLLEVKDEKGDTTVWNFELASPNGLMRHGWTRTSMKPGDTITVTGYLARDGSKMANALSVTLADGRKVFAGTSDDSSPPQ
jgi:hypothetical protein